GTAGGVSSADGRSYSDSTGRRRVAELIPAMSRFSRKRFRWVDYLASDGGLIAAAFLLTLACNVMGERVPVGDGFGAHGVLYGSWARDFHEEVFVKQVNAYYVQRILPAAVVHYSMRLLGVPRSDAAILRAFGLYAVALLVIAAWAWCRIARSLELS